MSTIVDLDLRPMLRAGGEPFEKIMETVAALGPGQGLRVFATFKPTPLLLVLESKGFAHEAKELDGGEWEVLFRPSKAAAADGAPALFCHRTIPYGPSRCSILTIAISIHRNQWCASSPRSRP